MCLHNKVRTLQAALVQNFLNRRDSSIAYRCVGVKVSSALVIDWVGPGMAGYSSVLFKYYNLPCVPGMEKG